MARRSAGSPLSTTMYWQTSSRVTWNRWATVLYVALGSARAASWTTARRSSSLLLISTSSWATSPPFRRRHVAESGHFYLARSGHFHFAATGFGRITELLSTRAGLLPPCYLTVWTGLWNCGTAE